MSRLTEHIEGCVRAVESLRALDGLFEEACELLAEALGGGHKVLACGNGGSAADSGHFTTELLCRFIDDRSPLPAISLAQDGGLLTATGNDYGFEHIFARQVAGLGVEGDVLVGFTTSGNSKNIEAAFQVARERKMKVIAVLGRDGGFCKGLAHIELIVPIKETARIQEAHKVLIHALCSGVEARLFGRP